MAAPGWGGHADRPPPPGCHRHPDRPTGLACSRCGRPACPECLSQAPVGFHCTDCVAADRRAHAAHHTPAPGRAGAATGDGPFRPVITYVLIGLNVLIYLITVVQSGELMNNQVGSSLFNDWSLIPGLVADGEYFRLLGSGFLHFGPIHLLANMYALYVVGALCEQALGRGRYLTIYLLSLFGGAAAVMYGPWNAQTAGASGAVFGLFGAVLILLLRNKRSPAMIGTVIVLNVIISVTVPGISLAGHLGGLVAGTVATAAVAYAPEILRTVGLRPGSPALFNRFGIGVLVVIAAAELTMLAVQIAQMRADIAPLTYSQILIF